MRRKFTTVYEEWIGEDKNVSPLADYYNLEVNVGFVVPFYACRKSYILGDNLYIH